MKEGWQQFSLDEITTKIGSGATPKGGKKAYKSEGISLFRSLNVYDGEFREKGLAFIDEDQAAKLSNVVVKEGDVLLNITGASIARCCVTPKHYLPARVNQHVSIIRPRTEVIDSGFLSLLLTAKEYKGRLLYEGEKAGATRQALTKAQLQSFKIILPSLPEQKRIVTFLDEVFASIGQTASNVKKNLDNACEMFESYLNGIFTQKGEKWAEKILGDLTEKITKGSSPKWQGINYVEKPGILFITSENVGTNSMNYKKTKFVEEVFNEKDTKSILKKGDVLTNIVGASIGRTAVFDLDDVANINQAVCLIRCDKDKLINIYLAYLLNSPFFKQILHDNEIDNARANLSLGFFRSLKIPIPSLTEQNKLISSIEAVSFETQRLESIYQQKLTALTELKQSILKKAVTGELTTKSSKLQVENA